MKRLTGLIRLDSEFGASINALREQIKSPEPKPIFLSGLSDGASASYLAEAVSEARAETQKPVLVIVSSAEERERTAASLSLAGIDVLEYKSRDFVYHNFSASRGLERERLLVLSALISKNAQVIVSTLSAASLKTIPRERLAELSLKLTAGDVISIKELSERLVSLGFLPVELVDGAGQFSCRGGIVDLWPNPNENPIRIEFFGDEIDRMVFFDSITQRSGEVCPTLDIIPASEVIPDSDARKRIEKAVDGLLKKADNPETVSKLNQEKVIVTSDLPIEFRDKYIGIIYEESVDLFSYIERGSVTFILGTNEVREEYKAKADAIFSEKAALVGNGLVNEKNADYISSYDSFLKFLEKSPSIHINSFSGGKGFSALGGLFGFRTRKTVSYGGNISMLAEDLRSYVKLLYKTLIFCPNRQGAGSLLETLVDLGISATPIYDSPNFRIEEAPAASVLIDVGKAVGYELIMPKIAVLSMAEDEGRAVMKNRRRQRILRKVGGATERIMSYNDLAVGDYVVHANYGIGIFEGMNTVKVDGTSRDYITIRYAGTDKLFVPCDRLDYVGKYIGERDSDGKVKLSKMGGDWGRVKAKAKKAADDIAEKLIQLYAKRQRQPGFAFPPDSEVEDEFAASFEYEETESQLIAIEEIKKDMMRPVPMNRLLCGDVGFGKTEVALRAAFKAILAGKQVAILVPTTILAMQHFTTATARMRNYPVNVEMISRFRTPKEEAEILKKVRRGGVDILIGTHKLLSKKLEFRDLGLLIIDEEQRFGVAQKEKLKEIAGNVDVLSLSATPIPRTLNMAMNGISDMSVLDEAPGDRMPPETYVLEYDETVILEAMRRELARGGQVLYLYNKVSDIMFVADRIQNALPHARVTYAHGQMEKSELEDIWQLLVGGEIDIIVCTSIIETGVDLPNANTLIIENADRMGLAQLHQLRGRVGRSSRQAYAYFTYRMGKALSEVASKRLKAIKDFAQFGAGFKVALRDLEIRGAGNLLGREQHGYIESVGYDLYIKLLNEAILEKKGESVPPPVDTVVDIKLNAYIPERYISSSSQRIDMYKKISHIETEEDKSELIDELIDRFGDVPKSVLTLIDVVNLRVIAAKCHIGKISVKLGALVFETEKPQLEALGELFVKYRQLGFRTGSKGDFQYRLRPSDDALATALSVVRDYFELINKNAEPPC